MCRVRRPYLLWQHRHSFQEKDSGTLCLDGVRYEPRGGAFVNWLFVRRDLKWIFNFRNEQMRRVSQSK